MNERQGGWKEKRSEMSARQDVTSPDLAKGSAVTRATPLGEIASGGGNLQIVEEGG